MTDLTTGSGGGEKVGQRAKLHFSRFEFKYVLPADLARELETEFQYFVELDPYVATKPHKKYMVRSLYFDNEAFSCYYEKVDGIKHRSKFRLRTYTDDPDEDCPQFLEIKGRHNNLVFKHRTPLDPGRDRGPGDELGDEPGDEPGVTVPGLYRAHPTTRAILARIESGPIRDQLLFELDRKRLQPVMLVDYWRRPYVSKYDPEFRMTFDDSLCGTACDVLFPGPGATRRRALAGYTILEVKFRFHIPKWFHYLIQTMELRRVSISKYCAAVEAHELTPELN